MATDGTALRGSLLELPGHVFDGRFRVEERMAEGGFAIVYKAWQLALERRVALKVLKPPRNQDPIGRAEFRERFAVEAKTIARLRHPDIVDVYDFAVATLPSGELAPWMALEWLEGETLALQLGRRRGSGVRGRDPGEAVDFLRPVMRALAHAHQHGIVHRDIKPSNIMVTETAQGTSMRVLDFGIAKIMVDTQAPNTGNTRTESAPAFSPAYAAPEQVAFSRTGPWTDVHALGLILTEVMTDQPPFSDPDPEAHLFEQVMAGRRPTPASKGRDVGPFEPIIAKALALSPRDRWRNASELLAALDEAKTSRLAATATNAITTSAISPTPIVEPVVEVARTHTSFSRRARLALALGAVATVLVGAVWTLSVRNAAPTPRPETPMQGQAAAALPAESRPVFAPAIVSNQASPEPATPTTAAAEAPAPKNEGKEKKRVRAARAVLKIGDGRDLFNDTK